MNRNRMLMIAVLALALGFMVSVYVYKSLQSKSAAPSEPGIEVIVAADDLQVGTRIEEHDIKIVHVPVSALPDKAPRKKSDVLGHGVVYPIPKGEFILPMMLADANAGTGLPSLIPPGMRAVSVRVNDVVAVSGFVLPGTRVDVLLTGTPAGGTEEQTTTVLQNALVLASGTKLERNTNGEAQNATVTTLLVTPEDAERLTLAGTSGKIQLVLRNPLDTKDTEPTPVGVRGLYRNGVPVEAPVRAPLHRPKVIEKTAPAPVTNPGVSIEVYQGEKKSSVKCGDTDCGN